VLNVRKRKYVFALHELKKKERLLISIVVVPEIVFVL
jgi:hypothetical protein